jgi:hypothetical protein
MTGFDSGLLDPATGAAEVVGDAALLTALVDVEAAHLAALVDAGVVAASPGWDPSALAATPSSRSWPRCGRWPPRRSRTPCTSA